MGNMAGGNLFGGSRLREAIVPPLAPTPIPANPPIPPPILGPIGELAGGASAPATTGSYANQPISQMVGERGAMERGGVVAPEVPKVPNTRSTSRTTRTTRPAPAPAAKPVGTPAPVGVGTNTTPVNDKYIVPPNRLSMF